MKQNKGSGKDIERALMFNDAVFAIALTLLVLELRLPDSADVSTPMGMWKALENMTPHFGAFLLSAILIGGNWISATNLQRMLVRIDFFFMVNLVIYLIIISLIPFCCYLVGNHPENPVSYIVFGGICQMLVINAHIFIRHCRQKKLFHNNADVPEIKKLEKMLLIVFVLLGGMMALAFYNTTFAFLLFLLYNLIPFFVTQKLTITESEE